MLVNWMSKWRSWGKCLLAKVEDVLVNLGISHLGKDVRYTVTGHIHRVSEKEATHFESSMLHP